MLHGIGKQLTGRSRTILLPWADHPMMVHREFLALSCETAGLGCWQGWASRVAEQWPDPAPSHSFVTVQHCSASGLGQGYLLKQKGGNQRAYKEST